MGWLVESAVGSHFVNAEARGAAGISYGREGDREVDFVVRSGQEVVAIESKLGAGASRSGLAACSGAIVALTQESG